MTISSTDLLRSLVKQNIFPAHIRRIGECSFEIQTVDEHCLETAVIAEKTLRKVGLGNTAYLSGMLHDIGKYTFKYRDYIVKASLGESVIRGSVNHTFAGVRLILKEYHNEYNSVFEKLTAEYIAYAIGAHHCQFDLVNTDHEEVGFSHRVEDSNYQDEYIEEAIDTFKATEYYRIVQEIFPLCVDEIRTTLNKLKSLGNKETSFHGGLVARLLLSSVVEGDRTSTASFMNGTSVEFEEVEWDKCLDFFDSKLGKISLNSEIAIARAELSEKCRNYVFRSDRGVHRLSLPTGSGKTLSSFRYALTYAKEHKETERIIYVIPLLSIIDQNAKIIRDYIGGRCTILEHHSNAVFDDEKSKSDNNEAVSRKELLIENWNAPIVITTLVQMLNTMFSDKLSCVRRFGSLCDSIIIFDEVQTVPTKMLSLFNQAITFLSHVCGADIVLCSATQPVLEKSQRPLLPEPDEIIERDERLWNVFKRTNIIENCKSEMSYEEIVDFADSVLKNKNNVLIICNKKIEAAQIYNRCRNLSENITCFHLSSAMCMEHRRVVLDAAESTKKTKKVILVSTQVVESGVDISYESVIRIQAGIDSIVQAAGRCNRNGESAEPAEVYVIRLKGENLSNLTEIQKGKEATLSVINSGKNYSSLDSDEAISDYYKKYYQEESKNYQDYFVSKELPSIYSMLSDNRKLVDKHEYYLTQSFKTAGDLFNVFDYEGIDIVVPYGDNHSLIDDLINCDEYDLKKGKELLRQVKPYTVSLFKWQFDKILNQGGLISTSLGVMILNEGWYDDSLGVIVDNEERFLIV